MPVINDGKFSFTDVTLVSKNGKFYFRDKRATVFEVHHDTFKSMLVLAANNAHKNVITSGVSLLEFLINQLEFTEDLFTALLYNYEDWEY